MSPAFTSSQLWSRLPLADCSARPPLPPSGCCPLPSPPPPPLAPFPVLSCTGCPRSWMYDDDPEARKISNELFKLLDGDKSGALDPKELRRARTIMLARGDDAQLKEMTTSFSSAADEDGDGKVSKSEWHEFVGSLYAVLGKKQFMSLARYWLSNTGATSARGGASKPTIKKAGVKDARIVAKEKDLDKSKPEKAGLSSAGPLEEEDEDGEGQASNEEELAALKIQSAARGAQARKDVKNVRLEKKRTIEKMDRQTPENHGEPKISNIADAWESLTVKKTGWVTSIQIDELVELFMQLRQTGLDPELATTVPMTNLTPRDNTELEDVSPGEVAHICAVLWQKPALSEDEARKEIAGIKEDCRSPEMLKAQVCHLVESDPPAFKLMRFRRLVELLSALMRVDEVYFSTHIAYQVSKTFEVPKVLSTQILQQCMTEEAAKEWARTVTEGGRKDAEVALLQRPFGLNEFMRFAYKAGFVDSSGQTGIPYADVQQLFTRVHQQVCKLMERRAHALKWRTTTDFTRDETGLVGRHELGILLQELHAIQPMKTRFPSPLHMCVRLLQSAEANPLVNMAVSPQ